MSHDRHQESMRYIARLRPEAKSSRRPSNNDVGPQDDEASTLIDFTEITSRRVKWGWEGRIPLGKASALSGRPKIGKGLLYARVIADLTRGELAGDLDGPRNAIIITTEDDPGDTLKPRLVAAGADMSRVSYFRMGTRDDPVPFRIPEHAEELGRRMAQKRPALVVIDPLVEFIEGRLDTHKSQAVRQALASLTPLAREYETAILAIIHLNKGASTDFLLRQEASAAFTQVVRAGLLLGRDPEDPDGDTGDQRVLVVPASNLARIPPALVYQIDGATVDGDEGERIDTAVITQVGESTAVDSHDLLGGLDGEERSERDEAKDFLRAELEHGPREQKEIQKAAGKEHSSRTLRRARSELGVWAQKEPGINRPWWIGLPNQSPPWALDQGQPEAERDEGQVEGGQHNRPSAGLLPTDGSTKPKTPSETGQTEKQGGPHPMDGSTEPKTPPRTGEGGQGGQRLGDQLSDDLFSDIDPDPMTPPPHDPGRGPEQPGE